MADVYQLTVYLIDGTRDFIEVEREMGDFIDLLAELNQGRHLTTRDTFYPHHAIVKVKFGWDPMEMMNEVVQRQPRRRKR